MARERYLLNEEESSIHRNQIKPTTVKEKTENWWFHYKAHVITAVLIVAAAVSIVFSVINKDHPDYMVTVMTEFTLPAEMVQDIETHLEKYAEDLNEDGEVMVSVQALCFSTKASSEYEVSQLQASFVQFAADASAGDSMLFIYDDASYAYLNQNDLTGFFAPVDETGKEYYLWSEMKDLETLELNAYAENNSVENVKQIFGDLKVSIRTEDGAAFEKEEKREYHKACEEMFDRMLNNEPIAE